MSDVVRNLYDERPHFCKTDGRRFQEEAELTQHMDELFAKNKSKKERTGLKERLWWQPAHEWCEANDVATDQTDIVEFTVGQRGQGVACDPCVVPFDDAADNASAVAALTYLYILIALSQGIVLVIYRDGDSMTIY